MKKRILSALLALTLVFGSVCGNSIITAKAVEDDVQEVEVLEENIEDVVDDSLEVLPEENIGNQYIVDGDENSVIEEPKTILDELIEKVLGTEAQEITFTVVTQLNDYVGDVYYTVEVNGVNILEKTVNSNKRFEFTTLAGSNVNIKCTLANSTNTIQSFKNANGVFNSDMRIVSTITYQKECEHTNTSEQVVILPNYVSTGLKKNVCNDCGKDVSFEQIPKLTCTHENVNEVVVLEATENEAGLKKFYCKDCNALIKEEAIPKKEHSHNYKTLTVDAECGKDGYSFKLCAVCGDKVFTALTNRPDHKYDKGEITIPSSCVKTGIKKYTCTSCGATIEEEISKIPHTYVVTSTIPATCAAVGKQVETCDLCGDEIEKNIPKLETHNYSGEYIVTKEASCTETGEMVLKCTVCDEIIDTVSVNKKAHTYKWVVTKQETETEDGEKAHVCEACGYIEKRLPIDSLQKQNCTHENYHDTIVEEATCCTPIIFMRKCYDCGAIFGDPVEVKEYNSSVHSGGWKIEVTKDPTYEEVGTERYTCNGCGYYYEELIPTLTCLHSKYAQVEKAFEDGIYYVCGNCGIKMRVKQLYANCKHSGIPKEVVIKQASETQNGLVERHCPTCDKLIDTRTVHAYKAYEVPTKTGTKTIYGWLETDYVDHFYISNNYDRQDEYYYDMNSTTMKVFTMTNDLRTKLGIDTLEWDWRLQDVADQRAVDCAVYFEHERPNGATWNSMSIWHHGENIASGYATAESVMNGWINSSGHYANLTRTTFGSLAVGVFHYYTFGEGQAVPIERVFMAQAFSYK